MKTDSENENLKKILQSSAKFCLHIWGRRYVGTHTPYRTASLPRSPCLLHLAYLAVARRMDLRKVSCNGGNWTEAIRDCARRTYFAQTVMNKPFP